MIYYKYGSIFSLRTAYGVLPATRHPLLAKKSVDVKASSGDETDSALEDDDSKPGDDETENNGKIGKPEDENVLVSMKHAAIRDYFLSETTRPHKGIRLDTINSPLLILKTCLQVFCEDSKYALCKDGLAKIAARFDSYLRVVEPSSASPEDRREIGTLLAQILGAEPALSRWISKAGQSLTTDFLHSPEVVLRICVWLSEPTVERKAVAPGQIGCKSSSMSTLTSYSSLFGEAARRCSQRWAQTKSIHADADVVFLHNYERKVSIQVSFPLCGRPIHCCGFQRLTLTLEPRFENYQTIL